MRSPIRSYADLEVWQRGIELTVSIYGLVRGLPPSERFELSSQMRRAAVSVPANVAEGHARRKPKPYLNHVHIALGSLAELETCVVLAERLGYIDPARAASELEQAGHLGRMLNALTVALETRIERLGSEPPSTRPPSP